MKVRRRTWWILGIPVLAIVLFILFMFWANKKGEQQVRLAQERLAAIDQARVIPDEQNAAQIYDDIQASYIFPIDMNDTELVSEIYTKLQNLLNYEQCYYPLPSAPYYFFDMDRVSSMREIAKFLRQVVFMDLAEDRLTDTYKKVYCLTQISRHHRQQPIMIDFLMSIGIEGFVLRFLGCVIMQTNATEKHLNMVESMSVQLSNEWPEMAGLMLEVEDLHDKQRRNEMRQWQWHPDYWWYSITNIFANVNERIADRVGEQYLRLISDRRMVHILIELRRFYNENGQWPETLEEIKTKVPKPALIDPYTEAPFIDKKEGGGFRLYSRGPNGTDENGSRAGPADDWMFWPPTSWYIKENMPIHKTLGIESVTQEN